MEFVGGPLAIVVIVGLGIYHVVSGIFYYFPKYLLTRKKEVKEVPVQSLPRPITRTQKEEEPPQDPLPLEA
jgi:hypothetical protein